MQRNNTNLIEELIKYLRLSYDFPAIAWEQKPRSGDQLVTELLAKEVAEAYFQRILQLETSINHPAFRVVKSRGNDQYRILVELNQFDLSASQEYLKQKQLIIIEFLNKAHHPKRHFNNNDDVKCLKWEMHHDEICFIGPSCTYHPDFKIGQPVSNWILNTFDRSAGFSEHMIQQFKKNLQIEDHKFGRVHFFKNNHFVHGKLFLLAEAYCTKLIFQDQALREDISVAAFSGSTLPKDVCKLIGFFVTGIGKLAQVNKSAADLIPDRNEYREGVSKKLNSM